MKSPKSQLQMKKSQLQMKKSQLQMKKSQLRRPVLMVVAAEPDAVERQEKPVASLVVVVARVVAVVLAEDKFFTRQLQ